jgi:hypothetical protein
MRYNKLITMSLLLLATTEASATGVNPDFNPLLNAANANAIGAPVSADFSFDQSGLGVSFTGSKTNGWTLTVSGTGNSAFYLSGQTAVDTVNNAHYSLTAYFTGNGAFEATSGSKSSMLTITGALDTQLSGVTASSHYSTLYAADLTGFGYNASEAVIGFSTKFLTSAWSSQAPFTGGTSGDSIYLFNQGGVATGFGVLSGLISQFETGSFATTSLANVESLAAVPLPLPAILFGTGLIGLMGFGRPHRNNQKSI